MEVLLLSVAMQCGYTNGVGIHCLEGLVKYRSGRRNILSFATTFLDRQSLQFQLGRVLPTVYPVWNNSIVFFGNFSAFFLLK